MPSDIIPIFSSTYSYNPILTLEEAGKTEIGNPTSIWDIARQYHLNKIVLLDDRIDGIIQAVKQSEKTFKPTPPKSLADYVKTAKGDESKGKRLFDRATEKYEREKLWSTDPIDLIYGIKLTVCADRNDKSADSLKTEHKIAIFINGEKGRHDLIKIYNRAWTDNYYYTGRVDAAQLKEFWTENLILALPYFSSFLARNSLTTSKIVPDFPVKCPIILKEIGSGLPFAPIIDRAIDKYVQMNEKDCPDAADQILKCKTIYYKDRKSFRNYLTYRSILNRSSWDSPKIDHMSSDCFSFESYLDLLKS